PPRRRTIAFPLQHFDAASSEGARDMNGTELQASPLRCGADGSYDQFLPRLGRPHRPLQHHLGTAHSSCLFLIKAYVAAACDASVPPPPEAVKKTGDPSMSTARKVLLVDDDDDLRTSLKDQLVLHDEFEVSEAGTATKGMEAAKSGSFDLVVFDVGLPDMDGREAVKQLRKSGFKTPIVMLTGNTSDADQILGLDAGANDYVLKPFKFAVLLARIRAQLRQHEQSEDAIFAIGHYTFKPASKLLIDQSGSKIRLTEKETSILKYLFRSGDKVVSRDVLLHEVWGYNAGVTTHTLETHIYRLRQKIEKDPSNAELLITESGGYKLAP